MSSGPESETKNVAKPKEAAAGDDARGARRLWRGICEGARVFWRSGVVAPVFLAVSVITLVVQLNPAWREALIFERAAFEAGEWWRLWTGNLVHFGWPHFLADTAFFLIIGWFIEGGARWLARVGLLLMPVAVTGTVYFFDPEMTRYAGLSGINVGFLVFLALVGWEKTPKDWLWAAALGLHAGEVTLEAVWGHGMVMFDDANVRVATIAHIGGAAYGLAAWGWWKWRRRRGDAREAGGQLGRL